MNTFAVISLLNCVNPIPAFTELSPREFQRDIWNSFVVKRTPQCSLDNNNDNNNNNNNNEKGILQALRYFMFMQFMIYCLFPCLSTFFTVFFMSFCVPIWVIRLPRELQSHQTNSLYFLSFQIGNGSKHVCRLKAKSLRRLKIFSFSISTHLTYPYTWPTHLTYPSDNRWYRQCRQCRQSSQCWQCQQRRQWPIYQIFTQSSISVTLLTQDHFNRIDVASS